AGFAPAHTAPEAVALSPELRGRSASSTVAGPLTRLHDHCCRPQPPPSAAVPPTTPTPRTARRAPRAAPQSDNRDTATGHTRAKPPDHRGSEDTATPNPAARPPGALGCRTRRRPPGPPPCSGTHHTTHARSGPWQRHLRRPARHPTHPALHRSPHGHDSTVVRCGDPPLSQRPHPPRLYRSHGNPRGPPSRRPPPTVDRPARTVPLPPAVAARRTPRPGCPRPGSRHHRGAPQPAAPHRRPGHR